jgi:hypothetical protein
MPLGCITALVEVSAAARAAAALATKDDTPSTKSTRAVSIGVDRDMVSQEA